MNGEPAVRPLCLRAIRKTYSLCANHIGKIMSGAGAALLGLDISSQSAQIELYAQQFHLNDNEIDLVSTLAPKRQMLIKNPDIAKVANLDVDPKSYWIYTNDPFDNRKRRETFEVHGFEKGLEILAGGHR